MVQFFFVNKLKICYPKPLTMKWEVLDTGTRSAEENMRIDADLLENLSDHAILHLYDWETPSLTYGHFIKPEKYLDLDKISAARRPTGGGIVFHTADLAFSVLVPKTSTNTLDNYNYINSFVLEAVKKFFEKGGDLLQNEPVAPDEASKNFCYAKPTKYDVMLGNRKVAGAAQRQTKRGFLHQGSIAIALPRELDILKHDSVRQAMVAQTNTLLGPDWTQNQLRELRNELRLQLIKVMTQ